MLGGETERFIRKSLMDVESSLTRVESEGLKRKALVFFGPPGAGKTTLLSYLDTAGLLGEPEKSRVIMNDIGGSSFEKKKFSARTAEDLSFIRAGCLGCTSKEEFQMQIGQILETGATNIYIEPTGAVDITEVEAAFDELGIEDVFYIGVWSARDHEINQGIDLYYKNLAVLQRRQGAICVTQVETGITSVEDDSLTEIVDFIMQNTGGSKIALAHEGGVVPSDFLELEERQLSGNAVDSAHNHGSVYANGINLRDGITSEEIEEISASLGKHPYRIKGIFKSEDGAFYDLQIINGRVIKTPAPDITEPTNLIFMTPDPIVDTLFKSLAEQVEDHGHDHGHLDHEKLNIDQLLRFIETRRREYETPVISEESGSLLTSFPEADLAYNVSIKGNYIPAELFDEIPQEIRDNVLTWYITQRFLALAQLAAYKDDPNYREYQRALSINLAWFAYETVIKENPKYEFLAKVRIFESLDYLQVGRHAYEGLLTLDPKDIKLSQKDRQPEDMREALAWGVLGEKSVTAEEAINVAERFLKEARRQGSEDYVARWLAVVEYFQNVS